MARTVRFLAFLALFTLCGCPTTYYYRQQAAPVPLAGQSEDQQHKDDRECAKQASRLQKDLPASVNPGVALATGGLIGLAAGAAAAPSNGWNKDQRRSCGVEYYRRCMLSRQYGVQDRSRRLRLLAPYCPD